MTLDWPAIDTILLDMDGTLLDLHFDNVFWLQHLPKRYAQHHGLDEADARKQLQQQFKREQGTLNWYCLDYWSRQLELDIVALKQEIAHLIAFRPHVEYFLEAIHRSNRRCLLVTNAHGASLSLKMEQVPLHPWFDAIVVAHDLGAPKEDGLFWQRLQKQHDFDPGTALLIDDTEAVLDAARAFGIRHLITLRQPDSQQSPRDTLNYPAIHHFDEIMPPDTHQTTGE